MTVTRNQQTGVSLVELIMAIVVAGFALAILGAMLPLVTDRTSDAQTAIETQAARSCGEGLIGLHDAGRLALDACGDSAPGGWADSESGQAGPTTQALGELCDTERVIAHCEVADAPPDETYTARIRVHPQRNLDTTLIQIELPFMIKGD